MTIIPCSHTFDQSTLRKMLSHDPLVQRYSAFFGDHSKTGANGSLLSMAFICR